MDATDVMRRRLVKPDCFGDVDVYDENTPRCGYSCLYRTDCKRIVARKIRQLKLSGGTRSVRTIPVKSAEAKPKRRTRRSDRSSRSYTGYDLEHYDIHPTETWKGRLLKEIAASALSAMGHEFGNFFDDGNFRFQVRDFTEWTNCSECGEEVKQTDSFCPNCGVEFES